MDEILRALRAAGSWGRKPQPEPDPDDVNWLERIRARQKETEAAIFAAMRQALDRADERLQPFRVPVGELPAHAERGMGMPAAPPSPGPSAADRSRDLNLDLMRAMRPDLVAAGLVPEDPERHPLREYLRTVTAPIASVETMARDFGRLAQMATPFVGQNIMGPHTPTPIAGPDDPRLVDRMFGSPEELGGAVPVAQALSDVSTEVGAILTGGAGVGAAARSLGPNASRAVRMIGATNPGTRGAGVFRDFARFAPVESALAASNPNRSTMANLQQLDEMLPEGDGALRTALGKLSDQLPNLLGKEDEVRYSPLDDTAILRGLSEVPVSALFSILGMFDSRRVLRGTLAGETEAEAALANIPDIAAGRKLARESGGFDLLRDAEYDRMDELALAETPVRRLNELPAAGQSSALPGPFRPDQAQNPIIARAQRVQGARRAAVVGDNRRAGTSTSTEEIIASLDEGRLPARHTPPSGEALVTPAPEGSVLESLRPLGREREWRQRQRVEMPVMPLLDDPAVVDEAAQIRDVWIRDETQNLLDDIQSAEAQDFVQAGLVERHDYNRWLDASRRMQSAIGSGRVSFSRGRPGMTLQGREAGYPEFATDLEVLGQASVTLHRRRQWQGGRLVSDYRPTRSGNPQDAPLASRLADLEVAAGMGVRVHDQALDLLFPAKDVDDLTVLGTRFEADLPPDHPLLNESRYLGASRFSGRPLGFTAEGKTELHPQFVDLRPVSEREGPVAPSGMDIGFDHMVTPRSVELRTDDDLDALLEYFDLPTDASPRQLGSAVQADFKAGLDASAPNSPFHVLRVEPDGDQPMLARMFGDGERTVVVEPALLDGRPGWLHLDAERRPVAVTPWNTPQEVEGSMEAVRVRGEGNRAVNVIYAKPIPEMLDIYSARHQADLLTGGDGSRRVIVPGGGDMAGQEGRFRSRLRDAIEKLAKDPRFSRWSKARSWLKQLQREGVPHRELQATGVQDYLEELWDTKVTASELLDATGRGRRGEAFVASMGHKPGTPDFDRSLFGEDIRTDFDGDLSGNGVLLPRGFVSARHEPSSVFTNGVDVYGTTARGDEVYMGSARRTQYGTDAQVARDLVSHQRREADKIIATAEGRQNRRSLAPHRGYTRDGGRDHTEHVWGLYDETDSDPHYPRVSGFQGQLRMSTRTAVDLDTGQTVSVRFVDELQSSPAQRFQKGVAKVPGPEGTTATNLVARPEGGKMATDEILLLTGVRDNLRELRKHLADVKGVGDFNAPLNAEVLSMLPDAMSTRMLENAGPIGSAILNAARVARDLVPQALLPSVRRAERDLLRLNIRRGGDLVGALEPSQTSDFGRAVRAKLADDLVRLVSAQDLDAWDAAVKDRQSALRLATEGRLAWPASSETAAMGLRIAILDAMDAGVGVLALTDGEAAAKFATGAAKAHDHITAAYIDHSGDLHLIERGGADRTIRVEQHGGLDAVVSPSLAQDLRDAGPMSRRDPDFLPVATSLEHYMPPKGGMSAFYDQVVPQTLVSDLRKMGLDPEAYVTRVRLEAEPGKDIARVVPAVRITDELRQVVNDRGVDLWGSAPFLALQGGAAAAAAAGEDDEAASMAALGLLTPGGRRAAGGAARGAGRRMAGDVFRAGARTLGGAALGAGLGAALDEEDPARGATVGGLAGLGAGGLASRNILRRIRDADSPFIRNLAHTKTETRRLWERYQEMGPARVLGAIRRELFDELQGLDELRKLGRENVETVADELRESLRPAPRTAITSGASNLPAEVRSIDELKRQVWLDVADRLKSSKATPEELEEALGKSASEAAQDIATAVAELETAARNLRGDRGYADRAFTHGVFAPGDPNPRSRGLQSVLGEVGTRINEFRAYLTLRRVRHLEATGRAEKVPVQYRPNAPERVDMERIWRENNLDTDTKMQAWGQDFQDINRAWMEVLEEEGVIAPGAAKAILDSVGDAYVPWFRDIPVREHSPVTSRPRSLTERGPVVHGMEGTDRELPIMDGVESMMRLHFVFSNAVMRQRAGKALAAVAEQAAALDNPFIRKANPMRLIRKIELKLDDIIGLGGVIDKRAAERRLRLKTLMSEMRAKGVNADPEEFLRRAAEALGQSEDDLLARLDPASLFATIGDIDPSANIVRVFDETGRARYYEVDEGLWKAIHGSEPMVWNPVLAAMYSAASGIGGLLRTAVTATPMFQIANMLRDTSFVAGSSSTLSSIPFVNLMEAWRDALGGLAIIAADAMPTSVRTAGGAVVGGIAGGLSTSDGTEGSFSKGFAGGALLGSAAGAAAGPVARRMASRIDMTPAQVMNIFNNSGAQQAAFQAMDASNLKQSIRRAVEGVKSGEVHLNNVMNPLEALRVLGMAAENSNRVGEMIRVLKKRGLGAAPEASAAGRDVNVDFARRGAAKVVQAIRPIAAFWGARMNGADKLYRLFRDGDTRWKAMAAFIGGITAPSMALYAMNRDNPEYWEKNIWERNMFWLVPLPESAGGGFARIPKPFEPGLVFGSAIERMVEYFDPLNPENGDSDALNETLVENVVSMFRDTFIPQITAIDPWVENAKNKDFTNLPVVPPYELADRSMPTYLKGADGASEFAKALAVWLDRVPGEWNDMAPPQIDNIFSGYAGTIGTAMSRGLDTAIRDQEAVGERPYTTPRDRILTRRFFSRDPDRSSRAVAVMYESSDELEDAYRRVRLMAEEGADEAAIEAAIEENDGFAQLDRLREGIASLRDLRKLAVELENDPDLDGKQKRRLIDMTYQEANLWARWAIGWDDTRPDGGSPEAPPIDTISPMREFPIRR